MVACQQVRVGTEVEGTVGERFEIEVRLWYGYFATETERGSNGDKPFWRLGGGRGLEG